MADLALELSKMLADGWSVKGFQQTIQVDRDDGSAASETDGYAILLQKENHLAIAWAGLERGKISIQTINHLTRG